MKIKQEEELMVLQSKIAVLQSQVAELQNDKGNIVLIVIAMPVGLILGMLCQAIWG